MNKYEGLFILDASSKEEAIKKTIEKIQQDIERAGGSVNTVQKMDQRPFARTSGKRMSGYYVNFVFQAPPKAIAELDAKFHLDTDIFRWQFMEAIAEADQSERKPRTVAAPAAARE